MLGNYKEVLKINVSKKVTINLSVPHSGHTLVLVRVFVFCVNAVVFAFTNVQEDDASSLCKCHHQAN